VGLSSWNAFHLASAEAILGPACCRTRTARRVTHGEHSARTRYRRTPEAAQSRPAEDARRLSLAPFSFLLKLGPQEPFLQIRVGKAQQPCSTVTVNLDHDGSPSAITEFVDFPDPEPHCVSAVAMAPAVVPGLVIMDSSRSSARACAFEGSQARHGRVARVPATLNLFMPLSSGS
jgi:hypothetical protein